MLRVDPYVVRNAVHSFRVNYTNPGRFQGMSRATLLNAVNAEGIPCGEGYFAPVYKHPVFQNALTGSLRSEFSADQPLLRQIYGLPRCLLPRRRARLRQTCIRVGGQSMFLGTKQDMHDIADAFLKVQAHAGELRSLDHATPAHRQRAMAAPEAR